MLKVRSQGSKLLYSLILGVFIVSSVLLIPPRSASASQTVKTVVVAKDTIYATNLYVINSGVPGPVVMIVGGVHGNETAGFKAAAQVKDFSIKKGILLVLPQANKRADAAGVRAIGGNDLNRDFPNSSSDTSDSLLAREIFKVVKNYNVDWLVDMHEGANYQRVTSSTSVGESLIYYPNTQTKTIATNIVNTLNKGISTSYKDFTLLRYPTGGSLSKAAAVAAGAHSFIFETCSRDPLSTRINYQLKAANMLLSYLNMK